MLRDALTPGEGQFANLQSVLRVLNQLPATAESSVAMIASGLKALDEADRLAKIGTESQENPFDPFGIFKPTDITASGRKSVV